MKRRRIRRLIKHFMNTKTQRHIVATAEGKYRRRQNITKLISRSKYRKVNITKQISRSKYHEVNIAKQISRS